MQCCLILIIFLLPLLACSPPSHSSIDTSRAIMIPLHIHLQEGFSRDTVRVSVNGREVFHERDITTRLLLGYAEVGGAVGRGAPAQFEVPVSEGAVEVEVSVPSQGTSRTITLQVTQETYLGVSIQQGGIMFTEPQSQPFVYM